MGAITQTEAGNLKRRGWKALEDAAAAQTQHQAASDPARRFLELLAAAIASGQAHVASSGGSEPTAHPEAWGWRLKVIGTGENERHEWQPQGERVGWLEGSDLLLQPDAALATAQAVGRDLGDTIGLTPKMLHTRLKERAFLVSISTSRRTNTVRRTLEGQRREVLQLRAEQFLSGFAETDEAAQDPQVEHETTSDIPFRSEERSVFEHAQMTGTATPKSTCDDVVSLVSLPGRGEGEISLGEEEEPLPEIEVELET